MKKILQQLPLHNGTAERGMGVHQWLGLRKDAALKIDPATAELTWRHGQVLDPYGVIRDLPDECYQIGRNYFARSPGSDVWVSFDDLSHEVVSELWRKIYGPQNMKGQKR